MPPPHSPSFLWWAVLVETVPMYQTAFFISYYPRKPGPLRFPCISASESLAASPLMCKNRCELMLLS